MKAYTKIHALQYRLAQRGIEVGFANASTLRRAAMTLDRWNEAECNGDIQRDERDGLPYRHYGHNGPGPCTRTRCADREKGAIKRIAAVCAEIGLQYYLQGDPRGASLYISREPLTGENYSAVGVAICD